MSDYSVSLIPPALVEPMWSQLEPHMRKAAEHTEGRFDTRDIFEFVLNGSGQLWGAFLDDKVAGILVTRPIQYPRKRCLDIVFLGGDDGFSWKDQMLEVLQRWALDTGCDAIESVGRSGLVRAFKGSGCRALWQVVEFPVITGVGGYDG